MAIITRWRRPPDNWCGYCWRRSSGRGMPTRPRTSTALSSASFLDGSLMEPDRLGDLAPDRPGRVQRGHRVLEDHPDVVAADLAHLGLGQGDEVAAVEPDLPAEIWPTLGSSFITDSPIVVLPQPDSPTRPRHSPERTENETPSTARTLTVRRWNSVRRSSTSSTGVEVPAVLTALVPWPSGWFAICSGYSTRLPRPAIAALQLVYQDRYTRGRTTRDGACNYGKTRVWPLPVFIVVA